MNKNFKVVFSKARNALMVVNEVTSSVQAKGTKTVIAAAVAAVAAGAAVAAETPTDTNLTGSKTETVDVAFSGKAVTEGQKLTSSFVTLNESGLTILDQTGTFGTGASAQFDADYDTTTDFWLSNGSISGFAGAFSDETKAQMGGLVTVGEDKHLSIDNMSIESNKFTNPRGLIRVEGGDLSISSSRFVGNEAAMGGVLSMVSAKSVVEDTVFSGNKTAQHGGAVYITGGAQAEKGQSQHAFTDVRFENNTSGMKGGAMAVVGDETETTVSLTRVDFVGNSSTQEAAEGESNPHVGGALYVSGNSVVTGHAVNFANNAAAKGNGGAVVVDGAEVSFTNGSFSGNTAIAGGAVALWGGTAAFTDVDFTNNKAATGWGGALMLDNKASVTIASAERDVVMTGNTADSTDVVAQRYNGYSGGFMHIKSGVEGDGAEVTFDTADGTSITIGASGTTAKNVDSITSYGAQAIQKTGAGDLVINGNTEAFEGEIAVEEGTLTLATGIGSYSIFNQAQVNDSAASLTAQTSALTIGTAGGKTAEATVLGAWNVASTLNLTVNDGSSLTLADLTIGDQLYTKTNTEAVTVAAPEKSASNTTVGEVTIAGDVEMKNLTINGGYGESKSTLTLTSGDVLAQDASVDNGVIDINDGSLEVVNLTTTAKSSVDVASGAELIVNGKLTAAVTGENKTDTVVVNGTLTTSGANLFAADAEAETGYVAVDGVSFAESGAAVQLTDSVDYTIAQLNSAKTILGLSNGSLTFINGHVWAANEDGSVNVGKKETFQNVRDLGNIGKSGVTFTYDGSDAVVVGGGLTMALTLGSIELSLADSVATTPETITVGHANNPANVLTLRADENQAVFLGLEDVTLQLQNVHFGEEASDVGTINHTLLVANDNVQFTAGQFTATKDIQVAENGTLTIGEDAVLIAKDIIKQPAATNAALLAALTDADSVVNGVAVVDGHAAADPKTDPTMHYSAATQVNKNGLFAIGTEFADAAMNYRDDAGAVFYVGKQVTIDAALQLGDDSTTKDAVVINLATVAANGYEGSDANAVVKGGDNVTGADSIRLVNLDNRTMYTVKGDDRLHLNTGIAAATVDTGSVFYGSADSFFAENLSAASNLNGETTAQNGVVTFEANTQLLDEMYEAGVLVTDAFEDDLNRVSMSNDLHRALFSFDYAKAINAYREEAQKLYGNDRDAEYLIEAYMADKVAEFVDAANTTANMAALGGAFSVGFDINDQIRNTIDRRSSLANLNVARNATGITPWVDVMGTWNTADRLYGSSGYEADIYGATLGADYTASCGAILGAAISIGQADANSVDASTKVDNDVDFWGVSIYGSHRIGNVNGKFDIGYVSTSNDLSANAGYFGHVKESLDADIFTVGVGAEYLATVGSLNVVPHAGIRWSSLDMDDSKYGADYDKMNLFQMPIGVAFSGTFDMTGWKVAPMLDISVVPTFGDKDAVASYAGGIKDTVRVVDSNPVQMTLGVNATVDAWTLGVNYGLSAGSDERLNNAFNFHARYTF